MFPMCTDTFFFLPVTMERWAEEWPSAQSLEGYKSVHACVHSCWLVESDSPTLLLRSLQSECTWGFKTRKGNLRLFYSSPLVQGAACSKNVVAFNGSKVRCWHSWSLSTIWYHIFLMPPECQAMMGKPWVQYDRLHLTRLFFYANKNAY